VTWFKLFTRNCKVETDESTKAQWSPYQQLQQSKIFSLLCGEQTSFAIEIGSKLFEIQAE
jgi:hypothetical protein